MKSRNYEIILEKDFIEQIEKQELPPTEKQLINCDNSLNEKVLFFNFLIH